MNLKTGHLEVKESEMERKANDKEGESFFWPGLSTVH